MSPKPSKSPKVTKAPAARKATSLTIDSKATAKTSPPWRSEESRRRAPKMIAKPPRNSVITSPIAAPPRGSCATISKVLMIALICRPM